MVRLRSAGWNSAATPVRDTVQRPARWVSVAEYTWKRPASIIRRTLRVGPKSFTCPIFGSRRCEGSVKRMGSLEGTCADVVRLRSRKLGVTFPLAWKRGNPTGVPLRSPRSREVLKGPGRSHAGALEDVDGQFVTPGKAPGSVFV